MVSSARDVPQHFVVIKLLGALTIVPLGENGKLRLKPGRADGDQILEVSDFHRLICKPIRSAFAAGMVSTVSVRAQ